MGRWASMVAVRLHKLSYSHNYHNLFFTMVQTYSFDAVVFRPSNTKSFHLEESISHSTDLIKINWPLLVFCGILRENYIPDINLVCCNSPFSWSIHLKRVKIGHEAFSLKTDLVMGWAREKKLHITEFVAYPTIDQNSISYFWSFVN